MSLDTKDIDSSIICRTSTGILVQPNYSNSGQISESAEIGVLFTIGAFYALKSVYRILHPKEKIRD